MQLNVDLHVAFGMRTSVTIVCVRAAWSTTESQRAPDGLLKILCRSFLRLQEQSRRAFDAHKSRSTRVRSRHDELGTASTGAAEDVFYRLAAMYVRRGRQNVATAGRHGSLEAVRLRLSPLRYVAARSAAVEGRVELRCGAHVGNKIRLFLHLSLCGCCACHKRTNHRGR